MEYIGEVLSKRDFDQRVKKYSENKVKHFYFMGLGPNEVLLSLPFPFPYLSLGHFYLTEIILHL